MPGFNGLETATTEAFQAQGFPDRFVKAFLGAADATRCVVLSRPPGLAASDLIESGYDLKGYFDKAKSCDWGPMAGFVCRQPHFNKKGMAKVDDNTHYIEFFESQFERRFPDWINEWNARKEYPHYDPPDGVTGSDLAYVQVSISEARFNALVRAQNAPRRGILATSPVQGTSPNRWLVAVACDAAATVVAEFMLSEMQRTVSGKPTNFFNVFTGRIWGSAPGNAPWPVVPLTYTDVSRAATRETFHNAAFDGLWNSQGLPAALAARDPPPTGRRRWTPVQAMINCYPAYCPTAKSADIGQNAWLNATTGDYDLFGVWPRLAFRQPTGLTYWDLVRTSDLFYLKNRSPTAEDPVFYVVPEKPCAAAAGNDRRLILEVATTPAEGAVHPEVESDEVGSINSAIALVAGMVNTYVLAKTPAEDNKETIAPNACFHSDDGANPLFTDLEFPIALFLPPELVGVKTEDNLGFGFLLETADEFVLALQALLDNSAAPRSQFFVPLNLLCFRELIRAAKPSEDAAAFDARAQKVLNLLRPAPPRGPGAPAPGPQADWTFDLAKARAAFVAVIDRHADVPATVQGQPDRPGPLNSEQAAQALVALSWADIGAPAQR